MVKDSNGRTPLHIAAESGTKEVMEAILAANPDLDQKQDSLRHRGAGGEQGSCLAPDLARRGASCANTAQ